MPQGLREGTVYMALGHGTSMVASLGVQIVASRVLGPETYGLYGLVVSNAALISGLLDPGLSGAMAAFVAEKDAKEDRTGISSTVRTGIGIEIALAAIVGSMFTLFSVGLADRFFSGIPSLVFVSAGIVIIQGFYDIFSGVIQGLRELKFLALIRLIRQASHLFLMYFLIRVSSWGLNAALSIHIISIFLALSISILLTRSFLHRKPTNTEKENRLEDSDRWIQNVKSILSFATPISVAYVASSWMQSSGPAIISYLTSNNPGKQLGIIAVLFALSRPVDTIIKTVIRSAFPYFVKWNAEGGQSKTKRYVNRVMLSVLAMYTFLIVGSMLLGDHIIPIVFGRDYLAAAGYLPIALLVFCSISLQDMYGISLFSIKAPGGFLFIQLLGSLIFVLSVISGKYLLNGYDLIFRLLFSMGFANLIVFLGAAALFNARVRSSEL